jgi:hypothetical protein
LAFPEVGGLYPVQHVSLRHTLFPEQHNLNHQSCRHLAQQHQLPGRRQNCDLCT